MSVVVRPPPLHQPAREEQAQDLAAPVQPEAGITLTELIQRARNASGEEQAWLCTLLNRSLGALSVAPDKDRQAELLLQMLDDEALHDLEDERRVACRAVAVEALLSIGYPWALQLEPDDVQFLRAHPLKGTSALPLARIFSGLAGTSAVAMLGWGVAQIPQWWRTQLLNSPSELAWVLCLWVTMISAVPLVFGRPWVKAARWLMGISSLLAGSIVVSDALTQSPTMFHLLLLAMPALGMLGALFPREPTLNTSRLDPTLPSAG